MAVNDGQNRYLPEPDQLFRDFGSWSRLTERVDDAIKGLRKFIDNSISYLWLYLLSLRAWILKIM